MDDKLQDCILSSSTSVLTSMMQFMVRECLPISTSQSCKFYITQYSPPVAGTMILRILHMSCVCVSKLFSLYKMYIICLCSLLQAVYVAMYSQVWIVQQLVTAKSRQTQSPAAWVGWGWQPHPVLHLSICRGACAASLSSLSTIMSQYSSDAIVYVCTFVQD